MDIDKLEKMHLKGKIIFIKSVLDIREIECLKIVDDRFGILTAGVKISNNTMIRWSILDLNKPSSNNENNMIPMRMEEFRNDYLRGIFDYIEKVYGIIFYEEEKSFKEVEVNYTFALEEKYELYEKVFFEMMKNAPKTYKYREVKTDHRTNKSSFYLKNNSIEVKIYDKTYELKTKQNFDSKIKTLCRIEYRLKEGGNSSRKIKEIFSSRKIDDISDEQLKKFFCNQFSKDFIIPMNKFIENQKKETKKALKEKRKIERSYITKCMLELLSEDRIFDLEIFCECIKEIDKKNAKRNQANVLRNVELKKQEGNIRRYKEILNKVDLVKGI